MRSCGLHPNSSLHRLHSFIPHSFIPCSHDLPHDSFHRNPTRAVRIGTVTIGDNHPIAVQSMTATHTQDIDATVAQVNDAGRRRRRRRPDRRRQTRATPRPWPKFAGRRRPTCRSICKRTIGWPTLVAPHVDKLRYNPGHLYHHEREKPWQDKVRFLADVARDNDCAMRVGVNCGSGRSGQAATSTTPTTRSRRCSKAPGALRAARFDSASRATASR